MIHGKLSKFIFELLEKYYNISVSNQDIYDGVLSSEPFDFDLKRVKRMAECQLIMNPAVVKYVHAFLGERLKEYEAYFGEIPTNEVLETRKTEYQRSKGPDDLESLK